MGVSLPAAVRNTPGFTIFDVSSGLATPVAAGKLMPRCSRATHCVAYCMGAGLIAQQYTVHELHSCMPKAVYCKREFTQGLLRRHCCPGHQTESMCWEASIDGSFRIWESHKWTDAAWASQVLHRVPPSSASSFTKIGMRCTACWACSQQAAPLSGCKAVMLFI